MLAEFIHLPKEGDTIGPYLIRKSLSASILGGFFLATHRGQHEDCLIHLIPEALVRADSRFQARYQEIIDRQKRLPSGPALAAVELTQASGSLIVRYEGSSYRSLSSVIAGRKEPLPEETLRHYLKSIAVGLSDAAKLEQGHFFLTPDFLFLNEEGEVRIAGIGLFQSIQYESFERFVSGAVSPVAIEKDKSFTAIEILSPEIRNFKKRDQRSDFYCIGMCAYFMLTGFKPERKWSLPSKVRQDIGPGWDLFISHCLEPKPADRFPHYRSFLRDLDHIEDLTGKPRREEGQLLRTLNRIPLPPFLENKIGMRTTVFVRLAFLGLAGVLAVLAAALFQQILMSDFDAPAGSEPIQQVQSVDRANIILKVNPSSALVVVTGPENGRFVLQGRDLLLHGRSGTYKFKVSSPRYRDRQFSIDLKASEPVQREVTLSLGFSSVRVAGVVGTDVYVEPEPDFSIYLGTIEEESGLLIDDRLLKGNYNLLGLHEIYEPARLEDVRLGRTSAEVAFSQIPLPTRLIALSEPEGASVFVDDALIGLTPLRIEGLSEDEPLVVRIEKEGFRTVNRTVTFTMGKRIEFDAGELAPLEGRLEPTLVFGIENPPSSAEVRFTVDGEIYDLDTGPISLPQGQHLARAEHPDFFPFETEVTVPDNEVVSVQLMMEPRPVRLFPVIATDSSVRFEVDKEPVSLTEEGFLPVPSFRSVEVEAIIRDHHNVIQGFEGKANEEIQWTVPLKPLPGPELGEDWSPPYFPFSMAWVGPRLFNLGSPVVEYRRLPNEDNLTAVRLTRGYWIGLHEVTQEVFRRIMGYNPSDFSGEQYPVDSVTYDQAAAFCERLTEFEREGAASPRDMRTACQLKPSGSSRPVPGPRRPSHLAPKRIRNPGISRVSTGPAKRLVNHPKNVTAPCPLAHLRPTPGGFSMFMAMFRSGSLTAFGTGIPAGPWSIITTMRAVAVLSFAVVAGAIVPTGSAPLPVKALPAERPAIPSASGSPSLRFSKISAFLDTFFVLNP
jgi:serine/threonine protein kinase